mmetsp:Transcript_79747/g.247330  ORF Transcript_79747/g.247330 Transcript_79747/m.247330 type:complete len:292 (-) Transcript_79747:33-908(-)
MGLPAPDQAVTGLARHHGGDEGEVRPAGIEALLHPWVRHVVGVRLLVACRPHDGRGRVADLAAPDVEQALVHVPLLARDPLLVVVLVHVRPALVLGDLGLAGVGNKGVVAARDQVAGAMEELVHAPDLGVRASLPCEAPMGHPVVLEAAPRPHVRQACSRPAWQALLADPLPSGLHRLVGARQRRGVDEFLHVLPQEALELTHLLGREHARDDGHALLRHQTCKPGLHVLVLDGDARGLSAVHQRTSASIWRLQVVTGLDPRPLASDLLRHRRTDGPQRGQAGNAIPLSKN